MDESGGRRHGAADHGGEAGHRGGDMPEALPRAGASERSRRDPTLQAGHLTVDRLSLLIDGALPPDERDAATAHLASCDTCQRELTELRSTVSLLRALPEPRPRRSFALGPEHAGDAHPATAWGWLGRLVPLLPAMRAATVAVALALVAVIAGDALVDPSPSTRTVPENAVPAATVPPPSGPLATLAPGAPGGGAGDTAAERETDPDRRTSLGQVVATAATGTPGAAGPAAPSSGAGGTPAAAAPAEPSPGSGTPGVGSPTPDGATPATEPSRVPASPPAATTDRPLADASGDDEGDGISGWRVAQVTLGALLAWLLAAIAGLSRVRRRGLGRSRR